MITGTLTAKEINSYHNIKLSMFAQTHAGHIHYIQKPALSAFEARICGKTQLRNTNNKLFFFMNAQQHLQHNNKQPVDQEEVET
jgi:hypothetical protein